MDSKKTNKRPSSNLKIDKLQKKGIHKKSFFHQRKPTEERKEYLEGMEEDPVSSYVPQTMTYQMRAHGIKAVTPMHNPAKNKHRSAEEEALDFTAHKNQDIRPHSARDSYALTKHLNKYLPMEDPSNYRTGVKPSKLETVETIECEDSGDKQIITNQISRFHPPEKEEQEDFQEEEDEDEPEAEESEAEPSHGAYHNRHKSQLPSGYEGSILHERDISISRLQNELLSKDKLNQKWRKRYKKLKSLYRRKCQEFENGTLAYLDIEGEQNKILEQKTIQLQNRVENEIKLIKAECEEIILNQANEHSEELSSLHDSIKQKDEEIKSLKSAYSDLEEETNALVKNYRSQLLSKESEIESMRFERNKLGDDKLNDKTLKINELERKISSLKKVHDEEIDQYKDQIDKYQNMLKEKEVDVENKLMYVNSNYRKKETFYKSEMTKFQKDLELKITTLEAEVEKKNNECMKFSKELNFYIKKFELVKDELLLEKSKDNQVVLDAKVRDLKRELKELTITVEGKDWKINQLESSLRKCDMKLKNSSNECTSCQSRTLSRESFGDADGIKKDKVIYELRVKIREQELLIERLQSQLQKNLDALRSSSHRYIY